MLTEALAAGVGTDTYNFGTNFMAAVSAACIVPPLITTFAVVVGKKYFSQEDHDAGIVNLILGCTHITEGAIPFMTKNIWPVMPIMMLGSSIASILTIMFNVHDPAPHGGFLVLPVVENGPLWVLAILIGAVVGGILFVAFKRPNLYLCPDMYMYNMPGVSDYVMAANTFLSERFLFGTAYPFIGFREGVEQFKALPFKPEVLPNLLYRNAIKALKLDIPCGE